MYSSALTTTNLTVTYNGGQGMSESNVSMTVVDSTLSFNGQQGFYATGNCYWCWGTYANATVQSTTLQSNGGWGLYYSYSGNGWGYNFGSALNVANDIITGNGSGGSLRGRQQSARHLGQQRH